MFSDKKNNVCFFINDEEGSLLKIRKDTFIKLFNEPHFLSKDRTKRFISKKKENYEVIHHTEVAVSEKIGISDWIVIKSFSGCAQVLEFKHIKGKTIKQRRVRESVLEIKSVENNGIGMLLQYYVIKSNGVLWPANTEGINDSNFVSLNCYKIHLPPPDLVNNVKFYSAEIAQSLLKLIKFSPKKCFHPTFSKFQSSQVKRKFTTKTKNDSDSDSNDVEERTPLKNIQNKKRTRS